MILNYEKTIKDYIGNDLLIKKGMLIELVYGNGGVQDIEEIIEIYRDGSGEVVIVVDSNVLGRVNWKLRHLESNYSIREQK